MCGVPYHAAAGLRRELIHKGPSRHLRPRWSPPAPEKKLVRREITRIVTRAPQPMHAPAALSHGAKQLRCNRIGHRAATRRPRAKSLRDVLDVSSWRDPRHRAVEAERFPRERLETGRARSVFPARSADSRTRSDAEDTAAYCAPAQD